MKKWILLVVMVAIAYGAYSQRARWLPRLQPAEEAARLSTAPVIQTNINFAVSAAGEISPAEQVSVRPEINGRIEVLPVDLGDRVNRGDLLFKLDDKELQQQRASNLTSIERAKLELTKAERDYKRAEDLVQANLISQELYDNTKTAFELAKNSLDRSQRDLAIIEERLTKTEVRAPFDCTVLTRPISVGQAVSGSGGFNSGTEVLSIADLNSMVINAHVNQADVPRLTVNQVVEVGVEAVTGLKVAGTVERIAPQASIKNNIKGFAARVLLTNVDQRVRPGMTANVKIPVASAENVLAVPLAAVFTERNPETGDMERFVYRQQGESYEKRPVVIGIADYFFAEVQSGLQPGDVVALELPKEEREKSKQALAGVHPGETPSGRGSGRGPALAGAAGSAGAAKPGGAATSAPPAAVRGATNPPAPSTSSVTAPAATTARVGTTR